jgi:hypothetical protein
VTSDDQLGYFDLVIKIYDQGKMSQYLKHLPLKTDVEVRSRATLRFFCCLQICCVAASKERFLFAFLIAVYVWFVCLCGGGGVGSFVGRRAL